MPTRLRNTHGRVAIAVLASAVVALGGCGGTSKTAPRQARSSTTTRPRPATTTSTTAQPTTSTTAAPTTTTTAPPPTAPPSTAPLPTITTPPTSAPVLVDLRAVDWHNHSYTLPCGEGQRTVVLRNGSWQDPGGPWLGAIDGIGVSYVDLDRDGHLEALVSIPCSIGAGTVALDMLAFKATPYGPQRIGQSLFGSLTQPVSARGDIVLTSPYYSLSDARCCASQQDLTTYRFENGAFQAQGTQRLPASPGD